MNAWALLYDELNMMSDLDWVSANGGFEYTPETGNVEITADGFVWPVDVQES
jgi:hypothetical protein